ncbi:MAG: sugar kinase [Treponema sp.]|jgi:sugar (pentulose or hexulose) kinase|nr:sugar kinase [Treponema sp.]
MNLPAAKTNAMILCADIGTSSLKAALVDTNGKLAAFSRKAYAGAAPGCWLAAFFEALEGIASQCLVRAGAVVISGNGPTLVPVLADGTSAAPLYWFSAPETGTAGSGPSDGPSFFLPNVLACKNRDPERFKKTKLFLSSQEWLSFSLGADPVTVLPQEAYSPFYWDGAQCREAGLDTGIFPPFVPMGSRIGGIRRNGTGASCRAACQAILPEGTPILAGGPDFIMALLGSAVVEPGMICDRAGSSEGINLCIDRAAFDRINVAAGTGIRLLPHARKGFFNAGVIIGESGSLFEKYRRDSGQADKPYEVLMEEISADGSHPARAVLDRMAFQVKAALEKLRAAGLVPASPDPVQMVVSGGQAKSPLWNAIKAKKTGAVLVAPEIPDGELAGNAVLGALYLEAVRGRADTGPDSPPGAFPEPERLREYAQRMVRIKDRYEP